MQLATASQPPRLEGAAASAGQSLHHSVDLPSLSRRTSELLEAGVPLTLLIDLTDPAGPRSQQAYTDEGGVTDWIPARR